MFDFFKRSTAKDFLKEAEETYGIDSTKTPVRDVYHVGINTDGDTTLTMYTDSGSITMTMNPAGTKKLIKMLEATLEDSDDLADNS